MHERRLCEAALHHERQSGPFATMNFALAFTIAWVVVDAHRVTRFASTSEYMLCNPRNTCGNSPHRAGQIHIVDLIDRNSVLIVSDEIHPPLTHSASRLRHPY